MCHKHTVIKKPCTGLKIRLSKVVSEFEFVTQSLNEKANHGDVYL